MTTASASVAPRTWGVGEPWTEIEVPIRFRKRESGLGWYVERADTGHKIGMVSKLSSDRDWIAYTVLSAYYPADADILTATSSHPSFRAEWYEGYEVARSRTRREAVDAIVGELVTSRAEAVEDLVEAAREPWRAARRPACNHPGREPICHG